MKRGRARFVGEPSGRRAVVLRAICAAELDGAEKGVLYSLEAHVGYACRADGWCWPAVATIAHGAGISERTAHRALRRLEAAGWIEVVRRHDEHGQTSSRYRVTPADMAARHLDAE
jgi:DNA-binding MarR family transcriptional regulator